ncbi:DUF6158 family protein [Streptomyces sp. LHD-70]|uniref:DUF6158 family protein n=1 Tax=Streptomyces sp. LHD-70 TaxID=3072140 RepID=UPI0028109B99|nr:DUF6158 family protein [Streptomyces sp. LHD-70]MDQ8706365.1 DUF6158 family protein [Streptomyces sp. LHD-70]
MTGVDPAELDDRTLLRELQTLHNTRHDTLLHASDEALTAHTERQTALENEYLRRHPDRQITAARTRDGARARKE